MLHFFACFSCGYVLPGVIFAPLLWHSFLLPTHPIVLCKKKPYTQDLHQRPLAQTALCSVLMKGKNPKTAVCRWVTILSVKKILVWLIIPSPVLRLFLWVGHWLTRKLPSIGGTKDTFLLRANLQFHRKTVGTCSCNLSLSSTFFWITADKQFFRGWGF